MVNKDKQRLQHIILHCEDALSYIERFGNSFDTFVSDKAYFNSVYMSLFQIGEMAGNLTPGFVDRTKKDIPWRNIKGMRNIIAHEYGEIDKEVIWNTLTENIPVLLTFCRETLAKEKSMDRGSIPEI